MKGLILFLGIFTVICCKAQTLPLITATSSIPNNVHVKDLNNELNPYVGTYKANFQGNEITLFITKEDDRPVNYSDQKFYRDALVVKYIVKNSAGTILQDTKNNNLPKIYMLSKKIRSTDNSVIFYYSGTNCGVGWGDVFLKKLNATQFSWEYRPDDIIIDDNRCPPGTDIKIYLPETKDLIFTKQ